MAGGAVGAPRGKRRQKSIGRRRKRPAKKKTAAATPAQDVEMDTAAPSRATATAVRPAQNMAMHARAPSAATQAETQATTQATTRATTAAVQDTAKLEDTAADQQETLQPVEDGTSENPLELEDFISDEIEEEPLLNPEKSRKLAIAHLFVNVYNATSDTEAWRGREGICSQIKQALQFQKEPASKMC